MDQASHFQRNNGQWLRYQDSGTYDGKNHSIEISGTLPTGEDGIAITVSYDGNSTDVVNSKVIKAIFSTTSTNYNVPELMEAMDVTEEDLKARHTNLE